MATYNSSRLIEMERCELDDQTVMSQYRSGYNNHPSTFRLCFYW